MDPQNYTKELPPKNNSKELPRDFVEDEDQERSEEEKRESNGKGNPKAISEWLDRRRGVR
jgi:hypothetical protein